MNELALFLGRFHPVLVHFPIALLVLAGAFELHAWWSRKAKNGAAGPHDTSARFAGILLALGAISACLAATAGFLLGTFGGYGGRTFDRHELLGLGVALAASTTCAAWLVARRSSATRASRAVYRTLLAATLVMLTIAAHLGATLTHGEGYLTEHAPSPIRALLARLSGAPPVAGAVRPEQANAFTALVQPILRERCEGCHGADRAEANLRLDTLAGIRKGGSDGVVLVPGRASESDLVRRIYLPASHKDAMPPAGRQPVAAWEAAVIRWWVDQGAPGDKKLAELEIAPEVALAIEAIVGPMPPAGPSLPAENVPAASQDAVAAAGRTGASVVPLANGSPFVEVHCTNAGARFGDAELAALRPLEAQIVWLDLSGTAVTDQGLETVGAFRNLTRLHLNRTRVSDAGVRHLTRLRHLEYLNLYGTQVTDAGVQSLATVKSLRKVYVWQTAVTDRGAEALRAALPRVEVDAGSPADAVQRASSSH